METPKLQAMRQAKLLLSQAGTAALAVRDAGDGSPFASFVSVSVDGGMAPLLLISDLSHHTKCLKADPRGSLLMTEAINPAGDPMLTFRMTLTGSFAVANGNDAMDAFVRRHPLASQYAGFGDFNIWRLDAVHAHIIAGFGRAYGVRFSDLVAA